MTDSGFIRSIQAFLKNRFRNRKSSLFLKIFFYILFVLIITEAVIFGFFQYFAGQKIMPGFVRHTVSSATLIREFVTEGLGPDDPVPEYRLLRVAEIFNADVWITEGTEVFQEKQCGIMPPLLNTHIQKEVNNIIIRRGSPRHAPLQVSIPLNENKDRYLNLAFRKAASDDHEFGFAIGLGIIGLMLALFIAPLALFIVRPVKLLKESSIRIAEGDLSHRISLRRSDELGQAARAFNLMADRVERMIYGSRELTANISHELRSPLTRIRLAEELLREKTDPSLHASTSKHLKAIQEEVETMDRLVGKILDFSKADLRRENIRKEDILLPAAITVQIEKNRALFSKKNIAVKEVCEIGGKETDLYTLSAEDPAVSEMLVFINAEDLDTVISNLISNAVSYTTPGGIVRSSIKTESGRVCWTLSNTSEPFPVTDIQNLFEPFFHKKKNGYDGTGLGLAIIKKLTIRYGGRVSAFYSDGMMHFVTELPLSSQKNEI